MKHLFFGDVHWSTSASLVKSNGLKYSTRLEHLIDSMNWINEIAIKYNCDEIDCCGDFFDRANCTDIEISALKEIKWSNIPCKFICGNHESSVSDLRYNMLNVFNHADIFIEPTLENREDCDILFLPYATESDRKSLESYLDNRTNKPLIIISHTDIAGINYGGFVSKSGYSISELSKTAALVLNGHLHNTEKVADNVINVGSLTAHNFTNDSFNYQYGAWILDTKTLELQFIENPYGFNFYKFEINKEKDLEIISSLKPNSVISIKCEDSFLAQLKEEIEKYKSNIIEHRITQVKSSKNTDEVSIASLQVDHLSKFIDFCKANINNSEVLDIELAQVCK